MTGIVFCQTRGRRFFAHGSEKRIVRAADNVESEKLLRCDHLSPDIEFCVPSSMAQYTREAIGGKWARQPRSGSQEERVAAATGKMWAEYRPGGFPGELRSAFFVAYEQRLMAALT